MEISKIVQSVSELVLAANARSVPGDDWSAGYAVGVQEMVRLVAVVESFVAAASIRKEGDSAKN